MKSFIAKLFSKKTDRNDSSIFKQYIISYICVLLLPIIVCSFYYYHSYHALNEHARKTQYLALENSGEHVNSAFADAINLGSHLKLNRYVSALSAGKPTIDSSLIMDRYYLRKALSSLQVSNSLISEISIYFFSDDYIVSSSSTYEKSLLPYMDASANRISTTGWDSICRSLQEQPIVCYSTKDSNYLAIAEALLCDKNGFPLSILCIQMDKDQLASRFENPLLLEYSCQFALINHDQILVSTCDDSLLSKISVPKLYQDFQQDISSFSYEIDKDVSLIINYLPLHIPQTALLALAEKSEYQSQITNLMALLWITIILSLTVGIVIIMLFSRRNYNPVSQIMDYIQNKGTQHTNLPKEYHTIMRALVDNRNELTLQRKQLRNNYLQKILHGEISLDQVPNAILERFSLSFPFRSICVIKLTWDDLGSFAACENASELAVFSIENVFQELLNEQLSHIYFMEQPQEISALINIDDSASGNDYASFIEASAEKLIHFLHTSFQLTLHVGISSILNANELSNGYLQASNALEYQTLFETHFVCCFSKLPQAKNIAFIPLHSNEYVINLVVQNHYEQLTEYFEKLKQELNKQTLSWNDAKTLFYFFYQVTAEMQFYCKTHYSIYIEALDFIDKTFFAKPLSDAIEQTYCAYLTASEEIAEKKKEATQDGIAKNVCQFIENNYFNTNINLNTVAEHFHISPSYLSKKFKEQYESSIIDYLYKVRIEHALPLLAQTNLKITDIALMTGFIDSNAFIRIFKKIMGITPGKYRESL